MPNNDENTEKIVDRLDWLDASRGYLIFFLFVSHGWKLFLTPMGQSIFIAGSIPGYFHHFSEGFVAVTGITLVLLREKFRNLPNLSKHFRGRGLRLILLALFIAIFLKRRWLGHLGLVEDWNILYSIADILTFGTSIGHERFLCGIGVFLFVSPIFIDKNIKFLASSAVVFIVLVSVVILYEAGLKSKTPNFIIVKNIAILVDYVAIGCLGIIWGRIIKTGSFDFLKKPMVALCIFVFAIWVNSVIEGKVSFALYLKNTYPGSLSISSSAIWTLLFLIAWNARILSLVAIGHFIANVKFAKTIKGFIANLGVYALMCYELHHGIGFTFRYLVKFYQRTNKGVSYSIEDFVVIFSGYLVFLCLFLALIIKIRKSWPDLNHALRNRLGI